MKKSLACDKIAARAVVVDNQTGSESTLTLFEIESVWKRFINRSSRRCQVVKRRRTVITKL